MLQKIVQGLKCKMSETSYAAPLKDETVASIGKISRYFHINWSKCLDSTDDNILNTLWKWGKLKHCNYKLCPEVEILFLNLSRPDRSRINE